MTNRKQRRAAKRGNVFGPNQRGPAGITPVPGQMPPQTTDWMVESGAMHSKSRGWLPAVVIRIATEDGAGIVCCTEVGPNLDEIIANMREASRVARRDVAVAIRKGQLPPHVEMEGGSDVD